MGRVGIWRCFMSALVYSLQKTKLRTKRDHTPIPTFGEAGMEIYRSGQKPVTCQFDHVSHALAGIPCVGDSRGEPTHALIRCCHIGSK